MAYYGRDYGRWAESRGGTGGGNWSQWSEQDRGSERAGYGHGWAGDDELGWSRPEFNVSAGALGLRRGGGHAGGQWRGFDDQPESRSAWQTPQSGRTSGGRSTAARDIMTLNPEVVTAATSLAEVARKMRDLDVGIIPVVEELDSSILSGVITDRDIAVRAAADAKDMKKATAGEFMSRDVESVSEEASIAEVFSVMKRKKVRRVPVTGSRGELLGIIAQADIAVDYAGLDLDRELEVEEVVERISEPAQPRRLGGGRSHGYRGGYDRGWGAAGPGYDEDLTHRIRDGWRSIKREARHFLDRGGYDRGFF